MFFNGCMHPAASSGKEGSSFSGVSGLQMDRLISYASGASQVSRNPMVWMVIRKRFGE